MTVQKTTQASVQQALKGIVDQPPQSSEALAATIENLITEKWDALLPPSFLQANYVSMNLDLSNAILTLAQSQGVNGQDAVGLH